MIEAEWFPEIGQGSYRAVYDLGDGRVVKVDWRVRPDGDYYSQSESEARRWREEPQTWMAPVLDSGPGWVMMPKATLVAKDLPYNSRDWDRIHEQIVEENGGPIWDLTPNNVGAFGDTWKVIDYSL